MLAAAEVRQLDRLTFGTFAVGPTSTVAGARLAKVHGYGGELQDFRRYQPGDDPRSIDWTIHARLRQLMVRVFRAEAHLRIHLLVDRSGSMSVGAPDKLSCAARIAAALSYVALRRRDAVGLATFDETVRHRLPPAIGRLQLLRILTTLGAAVPHGKSSANRALVEYASTVRSPGLAVVISDFFDDEGAYEALRYLAHRGLMPAVIQVVAPEDLDPQIDGDVELRDVENPEGAPVLVDRRAAAAYRARVERLTLALGEFCLTHGMPWTRVTSSIAFGDALKACVDAGMLAAKI